LQGGILEQDVHLKE